MTPLPQLPLPLSFRPALGRDDFFVADCNAEALAWIEGGRPWPGGALALYGPPGAGKSHLAAVWRAEQGASILQHDALKGFHLQQPACLVLEDAGKLALQAAEPLLHLMNQVRESGSRLLLTDRAAPARWPVALPDLASRLAALQAVALGKPDDNLLAAVPGKALRRSPASPQARRC